MDIVKVNNVWFRYTEKWILKDVNLNISSGEIIALFGPNGCGKTTLAKHMNGLLKPTKGEVIVKGMNTKDTSVAKLSKFVGYVFQNPSHQIFSNTVFDEVAFGPRNFNMDNIEKIVEETLSLVGLKDKMNIPPFMLSTGEKERLAIASALALDPDLLILDEPTIGQDMKNYERLIKLIKKLKNENKSILIISHDLRLIRDVCGKVYLMNNGKILKSVNPNERGWYEWSL